MSTEKLQKTLRKIQAYEENPELVKEPTSAEVASLVVLVLSQVDVIEKAVKAGRLDGYTPQPDKDYLSKDSAIKLLTAEVNKMVATVDSALNEKGGALEAQVRQALENIKNGDDGIVSEEEIARAAGMALGMIELPDFDALITERTTANPESIRDALELLTGDDRYKVEIADVQGLAEMLEQIAQVRSSQGGTIGKQQVFGFIRQAISDGLIASSIEAINDIGDVDAPAPTDAQVLTWVDAESKWKAEDAPGASGGEANTASNVGTAGVGVFKGKSLLDLEFKTINAGSASVTITDDTGDDEVDVDLSAASKASLALADSALQASDISDTAYGAGWDGDTTTAASKNAIYDKIEAIPALTDGDKGDITVSASGATWTIDDEAVTLAKMAHVATNRILGRDTAGVGDVEALTAIQAADTIGVGTGDSPQFTGVNVGHATDTTITRVSAGVIAVEGTNVSLTGHTHTASEVTDFDTEVANNSAVTANTAKLTADTTNVTAAGALMDSEVTNLAQVKAFDATDYAPALGVDDNYVTDAEKTVIGNTSGTNTGDEATASTTVSGISESATAAEVNTGTDAVRHVTPNSLAGSTLQTTADSAMQDLVDDTTPQLGGELDAGAHSIGFTMQTATGDGTTTVDWKLGNHFDFTFGAFNETFTFTAPTKPGVYTMSLKQDSVGSRTATWPATAKWPGGTAPTLTTTATTGYDVVTFRFDGTNYYGGSLADFS